VAVLAVLAVPAVLAVWLYHYSLKGARVHQKQVYGLISIRMELGFKNRMEIGAY
jgi:hypothetical protein